MDGGHLYCFPLLTQKDIEDSPSRREGVTFEEEMTLKRRAGTDIFSVAKLLTLSAGTAAIAVTLYVRFFALKSLKKNKHYLIAATALILAAKINDEHCNILMVMSEMLKASYNKNNPEVRKKLADQAFLDDLYEKFQDAELAIMITLKFDFNVDPLHSTVVRRVKDIPYLNRLDRVSTFQQLVLKVVGTLMKNDPTMVLIYNPEDISLAVVQLYFKTRAPSSDDPKEPAPGKGGEPWYVQEGLSQEKFREIYSRLKKLFKDPGPAHPADSAATDTASAITAATLTPRQPKVKHAAVAAVPPPPSLPAGSSGGGEREAPSMPPAQQMPPLPQRVEQAQPAPIVPAPAPAPAPPRLEQKRKAPGGDGRQPVWGAPELPLPQLAAAAKRPRVGEPAAGGMSVLQLGAVAPPIRWPSHYPPPYSGPTARPAAPVAVPLPPPAPAAEASESELEEGEIEEGEIQ